MQLREVGGPFRGITPDQADPGQGTVKADWLALLNIIASWGQIRNRWRSASVLRVHMQVDLTLP